MEEDYRPFLDLVFSNVSGKGSKEDKHAQKLMGLLLEYLKKAKNCIFTDPPYRESLVRNLTRASKAQKEARKSLYIKYMC